MVSWIVQSFCGLLTRLQKSKLSTVLECIQFLIGVLFLYLILGVFIVAPLMLLG